MQRLNVRLKTPADSEGVRALFRETWQATYHSILSPQQMSSLLSGLDQGSMTAPDSVIWVACDGDHIVGSISVAERRGTAHVWGMYVHVPWQRRGVGTQLLRSLCRSLTQSNEIEVRVLKTSLHAIAFYSAAGFQTAGHETYEMVEGCEKDVIVMNAPVGVILAKLNT